MPAHQAASTRWCPTPEQLMILEEMYYKAGVRTPNAPQIQQITAHLSRYGKIEGKNVFYWFQNHKARDRQKLRRRLIITRHHQQQQQYYLLQQQQQQQIMNLPAPPLQFHPMEAAAPASYYSSLLHPHHQMFDHQNISPDHFLQLQGCHLQEGTEALNLISKLEASEGEEDDPERPLLATSCPALGYGCERVLMTVSEAALPPPAPPCCRPTRTLDLFPMTRSSTGLMRAEEGSTSNSTSHF